MPAPHPIIAQLVALDTLKTWSLIATLFGDLDGDELSGSQIRMLLGHIGIKPEAIRVALHRLKSDGWIESQKNGREAVYCLSAMAQKETDDVAPDIYRKTVKYPDGWCFQLAEEAPTSKNMILLNKNLFLVPIGNPADASNSLLLTANEPDLPDWVAASLVSKNLVQLAADLRSKVGQFAELESDLDRMAFRLLVLHHWRRIALRIGSWAHVSFCPDGEIALCHRVVIELLDQTDKITEQFSA